MARLILLALIFFLGYTVVQALLRKPRQPRHPSNRSREGETMVQDPQCGAYLPLSDAIKDKIAGTQHYFCSKKCRNQYRKTNK
jgi:YHS domain-containing protein